MFQRHTRRARRLLAAIATITVGIAAVLALAATASAVSVPSADPFYVAPAGISSDVPGTILRTRSVPLTLDSAFTSAAYQLLYVTTDQNGTRLATVATLLIPRQAPAGTRRLVAYGQAEDSLTTSCAPSYTIQGNTNGSTMADDALNIGQELDRGWDVVVPDYEGPNSDFLDGPLEGHATLDAIRAAEQFAPAGLDGSATEVGTVGYSGGSYPMLWAADLAPAYAPKVNLVAVTAGGIPANLIESLARIDGSLYFGAAMTALTGLDRIYPQLGLSSLLTPAGARLQAQDETSCSSILGEPLGRTSTYFTAANDQALAALPQVKAVLAKIDLVTEPAPKAPAFFYNNVNDDVLFIPAVDQMVAAYCQAGATIDYDRNPVGDHASGLVTYYPPAVQYIADRFAGQPAPSTCPPAGLQPQPGSPPARCRAATVTERLHAPAGFVIRSATFTLSGTRIHGRVRHATAIVRLPSRLASDRRLVIRLRGTRNGRTATASRTYRITRCRPTAAG